MVKQSEANSGSDPADEISSSIQENTKRQESQPESLPVQHGERERIKVKDRLNERFPLEGGINASYAR